MQNDEIPELNPGTSCNLCSMGMWATNFFFYLSKNVGQCRERRGVPWKVVINILNCFENRIYAGTLRYLPSRFFFFSIRSFASTKICSSHRAPDEPPSNYKIADLNGVQLLL